VLKGAASCMSIPLLHGPRSTGAAKVVLIPAFLLLMLGGPGKSLLLKSEEAAMEALPRSGGGWGLRRSTSQGKFGAVVCGGGRSIDVGAVDSVAAIDVVGRL
jgi:hypothetical protein